MIEKINISTIELKETVKDCFLEISDIDNITFDVKLSSVVGESLFFVKNDELGIEQIYNDLISSKTLDSSVSFDSFLRDNLSISIRIDYPAPPSINKKEEVKLYFDFKYNLEKLILQAMDRMKLFHKRTVTKSDTTNPNSKTGKRISILVFPESY